MNTTCRALLASSILAVASVADANLIARWSFDSGAGGSTAVEPISGFDGTLVGNAAITGSGGVAGGALSLEGQSPGFVNAGDVLAFTGLDRFSIQAWVKTEQQTGALVVARHKQFVTTGYWLGLNDTEDGAPAEAEGSFHFFQSDNPQFNSGALGINDGQWHQIVAVRDTSASELRLYVDGVRVPEAGSSGSINNLLATEAPFLIGGMIAGDAPVNTYVGLIDEVRVWDSALDDRQVAFFHEHPDSLNDVLCGDANGSGGLLSSDALGALRTAVGSGQCLACICDANGAGGITAADSLLILRKAVGQDVVLSCPQCLAGDLSGLRWEIPCKSSNSENVCSCDNDFTDSAELLGEEGTTYDVTLRFRGVVEQKTYIGGEQDGMFLVGGTPADDPYNIYKLEVSDPPATFYLNAGASFIQRCWLLDVTKTIPIKAGATVLLEAHALDLAEIKNRDDASQPIIPAGVPPAPEPYNGQFIQIDVVAVDEAN